MSHCGLLAALTIILYGAPVTFLCDSVTLISACSSSSVNILLVILLYARALIQIYSSIVINELLSYTVFSAAWIGEVPWSWNYRF